MTRRHFAVGIGHAPPQGMSAPTCAPIPGVAYRKKSLLTQLPMGFPPEEEAVPQGPVRAVSYTHLTLPAILLV